MELDPTMQKRLLALQGGEISGHHIYNRIATRLPDADNRRVIERLAAGGLVHYLTWKKYTQQDVAPNRLLVWLYGVAARVLGFTFAIKLLERGTGKNHPGSSHHSRRGGSTRTGIAAVVIIAVFNYYIAVAREESFRRRFTEMAGVSLGVALFSFVIGYIIRQWLGVDI